MYTQLVFLPSLLLGGVMIEVSTLPKTMQQIGMMIPTTHAMNIINQWVYQKQVFMDSFISIIILALLGVLLMGLNLSLFKYDNQNR